MAALQAWFNPQPDDASQSEQQPEKKPEQQQDFTAEKIDVESLPSIGDEDLPTRRIHILGTGSIGTLVANSLKQLPNAPPITLLIHREQIYAQFRQGRSTVRLVNKAMDVEDEQTGFDVDVYRNNVWEYIGHEEDGVPINEVQPAEKMSTGEIFIYTLIVTVKGPATIKALQSVKNRVGPKTTILFMQNGLGQIDELNAKVFTDPANRPTYMLGIIAHGCYMERAFRVVHAGAGTIALGISRDLDRFPLPPKGVDLATKGLEDSLRKQYFPSDEDLYSNITSRYLLRTMTRCPTLACAAYPYLDLFQLQLEKLVSNCIINPFTALLDVKNGATLDNPFLTHAQRLLLTEIALVIQGLPELEGIPNIRGRFSPMRLELRVQNMATQTSQNSSSMREDMRLMRDIEIDYINGYIVKRGEEQGIKCVLNYMLMELVKARSYILKEGDRALQKAPYGRKEVQAEQDPSSDGAVTLEDVSGPTRVGHARG